MGDVSWIDEWMPSLDGIALKAARKEGVTEKQWVTIHGHPVNIGGGSSGGSSGGSGGAASKPSGKKPPALSGTAYHKALTGPEGGAMSSSRLVDKHIREGSATDEQVANHQSFIQQIKKQHTDDAQRRHNMAANASSPSSKAGFEQQAAEHERHASNLQQVHDHIASAYAHSKAGK